MRTWIDEISKNEGKKVELFGWVGSRRDHGKLIFIDLRDRTGVAQIVFFPKNKEVYESASRLRGEWVIRISGIVQRRPKGMENPNIVSGDFEIPADELQILAEAKTPPIAVDTNGTEIGEDLRMKYRYIDLRRERMKQNLIMRHRAIQFIRNFLSQRRFIEIETPILGKSTPEGARDYLVPARLHPGTFYALPQSHQQY